MEEMSLLTRLRLSVRKELSRLSDLAKKNGELMFKLLVVLPPILLSTQHYLVQAAK